MFRVIFDTKKVNRKVTRSVKGLKDKNGHSFLDAQKLIDQVHNIISDEVRLPYTVLDEVKELGYAFDGVLVTPEISSPKLIDDIEDEVFASGHEDATEIMNEIERQVLEETSISAIEEDEVNNEVKKEKKSPLKKMLTGFLGKRDKEEVEETIDYSDEFSEIDNLSSETINVETGDREINPLDIDETDLFNDVPDNKFESDDLASDSNMVEEFNEEQIVNEDEEFKPDFSDEFNEEVILVESDDYDDLPLVDDTEGNQTDLDKQKLHGSTEKTTTKKHEGVIFPEYDSYLGLTEAERSIKRYKERLEKEELVKLLGLNSFSTEVNSSKLDEVKLNYALKALDESNFIYIKNQFDNALGDLRDQTQSSLSESYNKAMILNYEDLALEELDITLDKLTEETKAKIKEYDEEQLVDYRNKLTKFEVQQEKALDDFKRQQANEKSLFIQELEEKKEARIDLFKINKEDESNNKKEELLDNKIYDLKNMTIYQLSEGKRNAERNYEQQIGNAMNDAWEKTETEITKLKAKIEQQIPIWKEEIEEERKIQAEEREEQRKQEQLTLKKEEIELQRQQLQKDKTSKNLEEAESISQIIEDRLSHYDEKILQLTEEKELAVPIQIEEEPEGKESVNNKRFSKRNKTILTGTIAIVLALGAGYVGSSIASVDSAGAQAEEAEEMSKYEQLTEIISELEAKIAESEKTTEEIEEEPLDSLLADKKYERAMSLYKDPESLMKIEETLYENEDLATLIIFNKTFETPYGNLDEAILSKNNDEVIEIYKNMKDEDKDKLSSQQKTDIALMLYQNGEEEVANKLLALEKE